MRRGQSDDGIWGSMAVALRRRCSPDLSLGEQQMAAWRTRTTNSVPDARSTPGAGRDQQRGIRPDAQTDRLDEAVNVPVVPPNDGCAEGLDSPSRRGSADVQWDKIDER